MNQLLARFMAELRTRRTRRAAAALAIGALAVAVVFEGGVPPLASAAAPGPAFTQERTITRTHLAADGTENTVDTRTVTVHVSQTTNLRGRQQIEVTWSGAHPTGGIVGDPNSANASRQEYPVVLMQCRGLDNAGAPVGQRLDPTTCWSQTASERYDQSFNTAYPPWRLDRQAAAADRLSTVGAPNPNPCSSQPLAQRFVPFVAANATTYYGGANGCAGVPPEAVTVQDPASPPGNTTYAVTGADGSGSATFVVWTGAQNASLGCSATVPCALVVVPIVGIGCDLSPAGLPAEPEASAVAATCQATGRYAPGELFSTDVNKAFGDAAVTGAMWWSASNWLNRITVPLTFAPAANVCDILDNRLPVDLYGSELMDQATNQWAALFCQDPRKFKFRHVRTGEPQAKAALNHGDISGALLSRPPSTGYAVPTVNSPIGVTGFAVTYTVDDAAKHPYTQLRLTPRLLAKLLSESYWSLQTLKLDYAALPATDPYAAMANNPQDLAVDPEFIALNPGVGSTVQTQGAASLLALSGDSDVMYALTSYLNADPEARAFLDGKPDPWGMVVNPQYRKIVLPEQFWPLLDSYLPPNIDLDGCLRNEANEIVPVPVLPLIAAPMSNLTAIAQSMQLGLANSNTVCVPRLTPGGQVVGGTLKARGRQQPGFRFLLGLTSLGDAKLYGLRTAALQTSTTVTNLTAKFTDATNRSFIGPTPESLAGAMRLVRPDEKSHTWPIPYAKLRTAQGRGAYPGTMVVYAAVPTTGLAATTASNLAQFLRFAVTDGQQPGLAEGQLPDGYLPLTAANGLSAFVDYGRRAADAVALQRGVVPPLTVTSGGGSGGGGIGGTGGTGGGRPTPVGSPTPDLTPWKPTVQLPIGFTQTTDTGFAGWTLPAIVVFGLLAAAVAVITQAGATLRAASNIQARLTQLIESRNRR